MFPKSPAPAATASLIYGNGQSDDDDNQTEDQGDSAYSGERVSMYVTLFEDMLRTVLERESNLFDVSEVRYMLEYARLSYDARYLLVRLCLRKTDRWHRLSALNYENELGGNILGAIAELCGKPLPLTDTTLPDVKPNLPIAPEVKVKVEEPEHVNVKMDEDDKPKPNDVQVSDNVTLAEDESGASLRELLECLTLEEVKAVAKQMKVKGIIKDMLIDALIRTSSRQTTLTFSASFSSSRPTKKGKKPKYVQTTLAAPGNTQADRLRSIVSKILNTCVKVNEDVVKLLRRVNLVYFRSTQHTPTLLTASILAQCRKRSYTSYSYTRTTQIWPSRDALLAYEAALEKEAEVDAIFDGTNPEFTPRARSIASRTPGPLTKRLKTPASPVKRDAEGSSTQSELGELEPELDGPGKRRARAVKDVLEGVYQRWKDLVQVKGEKEARPSGLERFDAGHVLTRVVCKGSTALGMLGEHEQELETLETLLAQRRWRRGRRGRWHERRALLLMKFREYERARVAVIEALEDDDTGIVYRPKLERRLTILERRLKVPEEERHTCEGKLEKAVVVEVVGTRIWHPESSLKLNLFGRTVNKSVTALGKGGATSVQARLPSDWAKPPVVLPEKHPPNTSVKWTGKSIWRGREDEELSVEQLALQHYEDLGYRGCHCEGRVVTTLFGLLFWDIIFADVPGAFETRYQHAPLDLVEDTFYYSRHSLVDQRLGDLKAGRGQEIIARVYDEHIDKKTWCVGVRWDLFEPGTMRRDLLNIVSCLGGAALAVICELMCEDYAGRAGGVPDLIVWNADTQECKFVEVKSPNDRLQENQRVWIDVLLQAGVPVEECRVLEKGSETTLRGKGKKKQESCPPKRKRAEFGPEDNAPLAEDEDELEEVDYSQLDTGTIMEGMSPPTPKKPPPQKVVHHAEVVVTSSPARLFVTPPSKMSRKISPEV